DGLLNDAVRPPVHARDGSRVLFEGAPLPHFSNDDESAGLDALLTLRVHNALGQPVESARHQLRWGDTDASGNSKDFVWVFQASGAVPPSQLLGGWSGAVSEREPAMYSRLGGGTIKGVCKPGEIIWSRVFVDKNKLRMDLGRGKAIELPPEETQRRWNAATPQWPILNAVLYGVSRDQMLARQKAGQIQIAYANSAAEGDRAMLTKAQLAHVLGIHVAICGTRANGNTWK
ncbi:MAG: fucose isomerase, partial [Phycisphaerae bacterium]|nr:fucose isomerase [Phycisphaerae bacterium]